MAAIAGRDSRHAITIDRIAKKLKLLSAKLPIINWKRLVDPTYAGSKPSSAFFSVGARRLDVVPGQVLMIGDDVRGDVDGAQNAGLKSALVKTGKF
jgi:ribonucleotide monophosphatase NagD (HAD superfamily)